MTVELKPCPFCGEPGTVDTTEHHGVTYYIVGCQTKGCYANVSQQMAALPLDLHAKQVAKWNRRDAPPVTKTLHDEYTMAALTAVSPVDYHSFGNMVSDARGIADACMKARQA